MENIKLTIGSLSRNTAQPNNCVMAIGNLTIYFSYETIIGFKYSPHMLNEKYCRMTSKNEWSKTTGTHLNNLEADHKLRVPHAEMMSKLNEILESKGLITE